jgi:hypothetical protein
LPVLTGASSLLGLVFGYLILPVWVAYLVKDKVTLVGQFDHNLPKTWRFDTWAIIKTVEHDFGQWVRGQLILGVVVGVFTFIGLLILSQLVDPIFGRYAVLLSIIAGVLELVPIIGPIISAVPAVLLAATAGPAAVIAALLLYTLVQQIENNFSFPRSRATRSSSTRRRSSSRHRRRGACGLIGAILALPMTAAFRDVVRYLFRDSPDEPAGGVVEPIGMGPSVYGPMPDQVDPYKILQVDSEAEDESSGCVSPACPEVSPDLAASPDAANWMAAINAAWD